MNIQGGTLSASVKAAWATALTNTQGQSVSPMETPGLMVWQQSPDDPAGGMGPCLYQFVKHSSAAIGSGAVEGYLAIWPVTAGVTTFPNDYYICETAAITGSPDGTNLNVRGVLLATPVASKFGWLALRGYVASLVMSTAPSVVGQFTGVDTGTSSGAAMKSTAHTFGAAAAADIARAANRVGRVLAASGTTVKAILSIQ